MTNDLLRSKTIPCEVFSGPILTRRHRRQALKKIIRELLRLAAEIVPGVPLEEPAVWILVAKHLRIKCYAGENWFSSYYERLTYYENTDKWMIEFDPRSSSIRQAHVILHEIIHWFLRMAEPVWLCGESMVFYYLGPVDDEYHKLAREGEEAILGQRKANLSSC